MDTKSICTVCGKPLPPSAPEGLCPECLLKAGLGTGVDIGADTGKAPRFVPPKVEELAPKFPQLEILEFIGQGGMGAVYKARQKQLDRIVALKILPPQAASGPGFAERFTREARALARLNHPHIVTLYEFGQADGLFYFFMEFVDGVNLRQLLNASRIAPKEALAIVPQICEALQFAHDTGIVHRDIKPENILLDKKGQVKIADFGVAKITQGLEQSAAEPTAAPSGDLTEAGSSLGTPQYMAPEQLKNSAEVDHRADIYSLGVVFYQMLTGELPSGKIEPPSKKVLIDVRLDEVVLRALEKKPELRYQQVSEVKTLVETIASTPQPPPKATPPGWKHYKDPRWNFELDIPAGWNTFPPVHSNSIYEVIRFISHENGKHAHIVFRMPHSPAKSLKDVPDSAQEHLAKAGFGNFVSAETTIGGKPVRTLDFDRPQDGGTWSCREYFLAEGTLAYTLGFGTTDKAVMFETFERMAKSFQFGESDYLKTRGNVLESLWSESGFQKVEAELPSEGYTVRIEPQPPKAGYPGYWPGYEYKSKRTLFGLPLLHVANGFDPDTGKARHARGIVAIGGVATGVVAIGGRAYGIIAFGGIVVGVLAFGGLAAGVISFGGLTVALALAFGGLTIAPVAIGGLAVGYFALGGEGFGAYVLDSNTRNLNDLRQFYSIYSSSRLAILIWAMWTIWAVLLGFTLFINHWARKQSLPARGSTPPETKTPKTGARRRYRFAGAVVIVLTLLFFLRTFVVAPYRVETDAAAPEIPRGSHFLVWKLASHFAPGDLIAYKAGDYMAVGRVAHVENQGLLMNRNGQANFAISYRIVVGKVISIYWRAAVASPQANLQAARQQLTNIEQEYGPISPEASGQRHFIDELASAEGDKNASRRICIGNLGQIESAKHMWALYNNKTNGALPTVDDLKPYLQGSDGRLGEFPVCPDGGTYSINPVGQPPTCSVPGHALPAQ